VNAAAHLGIDVVLEIHALLAIVKINLYIINRIRYEAFKFR
jgi:hypothetical protein